MFKSFRLIVLAGVAGLLPLSEAIGQVDLQQRLTTQSSETPKSHSDALMGLHSGPAALPENFEMLKLTPGFLIGVHVADDSDFSGSFRVDRSGDINIPQLGQLHVAGETAEEARIAIKQKLIDDGLLRNPLVEVDVLEYTVPHVIVMGEVGAPGEYPLLAPTKLADVLAMAGGTTLLAGSQIMITHKAGKEATEEVPYSKQADTSVANHTIVDPGDIVEVKRAGVVFVLGAVNRPGGYIMQESGSLTILQAVALAGGTSYIASTRKIYVMQKERDGVVAEVELPYNRIVRGKTPDVQLHPEDILFIPTNKFRSTFTSTQGILAAAAEASIYATAVY